MDMANSVDFLLSVQDETASDEELQAILGVVAAELDELSAKVEEVTAADAQVKGLIAKGSEKGNLLNVEINLDTLKSFGKWLYERLVGTSTKAKFEYDGQRFEFDGRNAKELASAMQDFEKFVTTIEAAKRAKNG
jgi:hypothetical protein